MTINIPECIPRSSPGTTTEDMKKSLSFTTACPPDVGPKTRLIAVCGITDAKGKASPMEDGWLFSDFYLFHHLFSPLNEPSLSSQVWMTTEEPKDLVQKYGEYVQEDSKGEQRVVLDKNMLPGIEQSGNLCVVSEDDLLKRFLSNLREQSLLAKSESQHLLVLVFGHGDMETLGMTLGGDRPRSNLKIEDIKRSLQPSTPATLFTTSSFSGDWIVQPIVTTIKAKNESWSMPSKLLSRPNASVATSAILQASIAINESQEITREVHDDPDHISYMEAIYESYKGFDHFADDRMIHFSPQDDQWALHFKGRSGIPLSQLKSRWESLRSLPTGHDASMGSGSDDTETSLFRISRRRSKVKYAGRFYILNANPEMPYMKTKAHPFESGCYHVNE